MWAWSWPSPSSTPNYPENSISIQNMKSNEMLYKLLEYKGEKQKIMENEKKILY